jgi:hypothetical protein
MKILALTTLFFLTGCAASFVSQYNVEKSVDEFNDNNVTVTMSGGAIDVDFIGIVTEPAELNPRIVKNKNNELLYASLVFNLEQNHLNWLNISKDSQMTLLLNDGKNKIILKANYGDTNYSISGATTSKYWDMGSFSISYSDLKEIGLAKNIKIRVSGISSSIDFPRTNKKIIENLIPNFRTFYDAEVAPYIN